MSEEKTSPRPRQVTTAGVMAVVGSLLLVLGLFDTLRRLRTPEAREEVDDFLSRSPGNTLGIDTAQVIDLMRALTFVSGALAAMGLVFAIYVLQRHRGARIGFTVVAALLVLTVPVAGLMPIFLAVSALLLWSQPARDWFLGRAPAPAPSGGGSSRLLTEADPPRPVPSEPPAPSGGSHAAPPPYGQGFGQGYDQPQAQGYGQPVGDQPAAWYPPAAPNPYAGPYPGPNAGPFTGPFSGTGPTPYGAPDPDKRPLTVTIAAVLTWVGAGLTALMMLAFTALLGAGGDAFVDEFERAARESDVTLDLDADEIISVGWVVAAVMLVWSLIAIVLAVLAFRRSNGARWTLAVSAAMTALLSLVAILSLLSAVTLLLGGAVVVLLFTGGANQWYSRRSGTPGYPQQQEPPRRNQPW